MYVSDTCVICLSEFFEHFSATCCRYIGKQAVEKLGKEPVWISNDVGDRSGQFSDEVSLKEHLVVYSPLRTCHNIPCKHMHLHLKPPKLHT